MHDYLGSHYSLSQTTVGSIQPFLHRRYRILHVLYVLCNCTEQSHSLLSSVTAPASKPCPPQFHTVTDSCQLRGNSALIGRWSASVELDVGGPQRRGIRQYNLKSSSRLDWLNFRRHASAYATLKLLNCLYNNISVFTIMVDKRKYKTDISTKTGERKPTEQGRI